MSNNKMRVDNNNKKEDGRFSKKHIKHDPQDESSRAVFNNPIQRQELDRK